MKLFFYSENFVLNAIKYGAATSIILLMSIVYIIFTNERNNDLKNDIERTEINFINVNKNNSENLVNRIYQLIEMEKDFEKRNFDKEIKNEINEAYSLVMSIYEENINKEGYSKESTIEKIKSVLRTIRFNENGYLFIFDMNGTNILNTEFPEIENKNLWDYQDLKGNYTVKEMSILLQNKEETPFEWYWKKNQSDDKEYYKIGYLKKFEPYGFFIGTGYYKDDYENDAKKVILEKLNHYTLRKNEHFFIYDTDGICLVHPKKDLIGTSRYNLQNDEGKFPIQDNINFVLKNKEGFQEYHSTVKLDTTLDTSHKVSYLKLHENFGWMIGSGFYLDQLKNEINEKTATLIEKNDEYIQKRAILTILATIVLVVISFYLSKIIKGIFENYRLKINLEAKNSLEKEKLMLQQSKMAIMGEMIANIAHQWKQPLNLISISSGLIKINQEVKDFSTPEEINKTIDNIDTSVKYLSETIDDFRNFFKPDKEKSYFHISDSINQTIKLVSSQFKNNSIELLQEIENVELLGYQNELSQVLINILKNAKDELIKLDNSKRRLVLIKTYVEYENLIIEIKDSAGGIPENIKNKIFDAYFTTKKDDEGTGIGLYMSKQIIEGMKGKIEVSNEEFKFENKTYKGASFKISILLPTFNS